MPESLKSKASDYVYHHVAIYFKGTKPIRVGDANENKITVRRIKAFYEHIEKSSNRTNTLRQPDKKKCRLQIQRPFLAGTLFYCVNIALSGCGIF